MIEIQNINKKYTKTLFSNLSFSINPGDFIAFHGPSGTGKTTLLRILAGLESPDSGTLKNSFQSIGYIFQDFQLFPHLNVLENLCVAFKSLSKRERVEIEKSARKLLNAYDIEYLSEQYPDSLSGGEKQRVAIARCLMHTPDLILVDEATSSLDTKRTLEFMETLKELNNQGIAIVFITHDQNLESLYAKKILKIQDYS